MMAMKLRCSHCEEELKPHCKHCTWLKCTTIGCTAGVYDLDRLVLLHRDGTLEPLASE